MITLETSTPTKTLKSISKINGPGSRRAAGDVILTSQRNWTSLLAPPKTAALKVGAVGAELLKTLSSRSRGNAFESWYDW